MPPLRYSDPHRSEGQDHWSPMPLAAPTESFLAHALIWTPVRLWPLAVMSVLPHSVVGITGTQGQDVIHALKRNGKARMLTEVKSASLTNVSSVCAALLHGVTAPPAQAVKSDTTKARTHKGWRDGSGGKSHCCSCRGPGFAFQH